MNRHLKELKALVNEINMEQSEHHRVRWWFERMDYVEKNAYCPLCEPFRFGNVKVYCQKHAWVLENNGSRRL